MEEASARSRNAARRELIQDHLQHQGGAIADGDSWVRSAPFFNGQQRVVPDRLPLTEAVEVAPDLKAIARGG